MPDLVAIDVVLVCRDCGSPFTWSAHEQTTFADYGWTAPRRCLQCRATRRAQRRQAITAEREAAIAHGKPLVCAVCRATWHFRDGEAEFYAVRGWPPPRRCPRCRRVGLGAKVSPKRREKLCLNP